MSRYTIENESLKFNPEEVAVGICHSPLTGEDHEVIFQTSAEEPSDWRWLTEAEKPKFAKWREQGGHFIELGQL